MLKNWMKTFLRFISLQAVAISILVAADGANKPMLDASFRSSYVKIGDKTLLIQHTTNAVHTIIVNGGKQTGQVECTVHVRGTGTELDAKIELKNGEKSLCLLPIDGETRVAKATSSGGVEVQVVRQTGGKFFAEEMYKALGKNVEPRTVQALMERYGVWSAVKN